MSPQPPNTFLILTAHLFQVKQDVPQDSYLPPPLPPPLSPAPRPGQVWLQASEEEVTWGTVREALLALKLDQPAAVVKEKYCSTPPAPSTTTEAAPPVKTEQKPSEKTVSATLETIMIVNPTSRFDVLIRYKLAPPTHTCNRVSS